jgi:adenosylcobinamide kinase/adenosylcobinamide-phosphate guanylyltransferase
MITLLTGGHRSGKTGMALQLAAAYERKVYIATAEPLDNEMRLKIKNHQAERDASYSTVEEPLELPKVLIAGDAPVIIVDCLTVWVNNLLYYDKSAEDYFADLCDCLPQLNTDVIMITNESSLCLIAGDKESRRYMSLLAGLNRSIAAIADKTCLMISGLPLWLK